MYSFPPLFTYIVFHAVAYMLPRALESGDCDTDECNVKHVSFPPCDFQTRHFNFPLIFLRRHVKVLNALRRESNHSKCKLRPAKCKRCSLPRPLWRQTSQGCCSASGWNLEVSFIINLERQAARGRRAANTLHCRAIFLITLFLIH